MLANTKERALPSDAARSLEDYLVYLKHVALYKFVAPYCARKRVLDLGCGEGYGSGTLSGVARFVVAADYSFEAVAHASRKYSHDRVAFVVCDAQALPFQLASFDTVVSFEVIEHIRNVGQYLNEIKRVAATGVSIISTPNRRLRLLPFQKPWNRFHLREYDDLGLERAVRQIDARVRILGITATPTILEIEKRRVKQNPLIAYTKMIAQLVLPNAIYNRLARFKQRFDKPDPMNSMKVAPSNFSTEDFLVSENCLRDCINLIAFVESDAAESAVSP